MIKTQWPTFLCLLPVPLVMAAVAGAAAGSQPDLLERALETHERFDQREWAYTITIVEDGKTTVARHDPKRPTADRWTLVSIDGLGPTPAEFEKFREDHTDASDEESESSGEEVREMISAGSTKLVEETADYAVYSFEPTGENEEDQEFNRHLDATLRIAKNRDAPYVESIEMRADKPVSAAIGVKIKEFLTVMTFGPVGAERSVLPLTVDVRLKGRALLIKKLDQAVEVRYTDYQQPSP